MFVKFWADRELRKDAATKKLLEEGERVKLPKNVVTFSSHWIESIEKQVENPINDNFFKKLRDDLEIDITQGTKKRIFDRSERIDLSPDTIKAVVRRLEHFDMFGIDEDLNGRLFETFLSATMRGEELGQYFTPRSIILLMTRMADLKISRTRIDKVMDGCCGTGGFLIEALAEMRNKVRNNKSLTRDEKDTLIKKLSNECLYGIDFGKNPPIARIARINMYLHGDGGSRIYYADGLDKELEVAKGQDPEVIRNQRELRQDLQNGLAFDVALTNPPFSMTKELSNETEARILKQYDLAKVEGTSRFRPSLRSSAMVLERYCDFLKPGGRLFTVMDDTVLASDEFREVRKFVRKHYIIRAIVSLPADAFHRSGARVKTSILCLEKKIKEDDQQPNVFVAFSQNLGVDDLTPRAPSSDVAEARNKANTEIEKITTDFLRFLDGASDVATISPDRVQDRLDLKNVVPLQGRYVTKWKQQGIEVKRLGDVASPVSDELRPQEYTEQEFTLIKVTYGGECTIVKKQKGKNVKPTVMTRVHTGDLVFSNIRAINGAIGVVPPELDGAILSGSFTVLRCPTPTDTVYLWSILRTHEIRADLMSPSVGSGRYTLDWEKASQVQIPWLKELERKNIADGFVKSWDMAKQIPQLQKASLEAIAELGVESEESKRRFKENQPPQ
jgi:type I restriction enzyme M protein